MGAHAHILPCVQLYLLKKQSGEKVQSAIYMYIKKEQKVSMYTEFSKDTAEKEQKRFKEIYHTAILPCLPFEAKHKINIYIN